MAYTVLLKLCLVGLLLCTPKPTEGNAGSVYQIGHLSRFSDKQPQWASVTFLLDGPVQQTGIVFALSAYFSTTTKVIFQIWRPSDIITRKYTLVTEWTITPSSVNSTEIVYLSHLNVPCFPVLPGDRLGLHFLEVPGAVPYQFDASKIDTYGYDNRGGSRPVVGDTVQFESPGYPYAFSAAAHIYSSPSGLGGRPTSCPNNLLVTGEMTPHTSPTFPVQDPATTVTLAEKPKTDEVRTQRSEMTTVTPKQQIGKLDGGVLPEQERVARIGNPIKETYKMSEYTSFTYLLHSKVQTEGVVFGLSAFFINMHPVEFQIWRPADVTGRSFKLIQRWDVLPSSVNTSQVIYFYEERLPCVRVYPGDRLGLFFPKVPGSVPYEFDSTQTETYMYDTRKQPYPKVGEWAQFDNLGFPFVFSASAFIDQDAKNYPGTANSPECPLGLRITGDTDPSATQRPTVSIPVTSPDMTPGTEEPTEGQGQDTKPTSGSSSDQDEQAVYYKLRSVVGQCDWCWHVLSPYVILAILAWLFVLTVAVVIAAMCHSCRRKTMGDLYLRNSGYGTMPSDVWQNYFTNSLSSKQDKKSFIVEPSYAHIEEERTAF